MSIFDAPASPRPFDILGILINDQTPMHLACYGEGEKQIGVCSVCSTPVYDADPKVAEYTGDDPDPDYLAHLSCHEGNGCRAPITYDDLSNDARDGEMTICVACGKPILDDAGSIQTTYNEHAARSLYEGLASTFTGNAPFGIRGVFHLATLARETARDTANWRQADGLASIDDEEWQGAFTCEITQTKELIVLVVLRHYAESPDEMDDPRAVWLAWYRVYAPYETIAQPRDIDDQEWQAMDRTARAVASFQADDTESAIDGSNETLPPSDFPDGARTFAEILGAAGVPASALYDLTQYNRVV